MSNIYTSIESRKYFLETIIPNNPGFVILKFGAEWCGPCSMIHDYIENEKKMLPKNVWFYDLDVDECFDLYAFLKQKKMVSGIPAILVYKRGNVSFASDYSVLGTEQRDLDHVFDIIKEVPEPLPCTHESHY